MMRQQGSKQTLLSTPLSGQGEEETPDCLSLVWKPEEPQVAEQGPQSDQ